MLDGDGDVVERLGRALDRPALGLDLADGVLCEAVPLRVADRGLLGHRLDGVLGPQLGHHLRLQVHQAQLVVRPEDEAPVASRGQLACPRPRRPRVNDTLRRHERGVEPPVLLVLPREQREALLLGRAEVSVVEGSHGERRLLLVVLVVAGRDPSARDAVAAPRAVGLVQHLVRRPLRRRRLVGGPCRPHRRPDLRRLVGQVGVALDVGHRRLQRAEVSRVRLGGRHHLQVHLVDAIPTSGLPLLAAGLVVDVGGVLVAVLVEHHAVAGVDHLRDAHQRARDVGDPELGVHQRVRAHRHADDRALALVVDLVATRTLVRRRVAVALALQQVVRAR